SWPVSAATSLPRTCCATASRHWASASRMDLTVVAGGWLSAEPSGRSRQPLGSIPVTGHGDRGRAAQWVMALVAQPSLGPRGEYLDDADRNGAPRSQAYLLEAAALHLALLSVPGVGTVKAALLLKERRGIW